MQVGEVPEPSPGCRAFIEACGKLGFARNPATMANGSKASRRTSSTSIAAAVVARHRLSQAALAGPTSRWEVERLGLRILVENGRAAGVVVRGPAGRGTWRARREVILSPAPIEEPEAADALGIGDGAALQALGHPP